MTYGYARVSTKGQERNGNSLEDQIRVLRDAGCTEVYHDSYTGTKMERPSFSVLMSKIQPGDTLVVTKLDRFARSASDGAKLVQELVGRGIHVNVLNMGMADNSSMGKLMVTILLAFAEFERDMIVERTSAGKAVAKANNPEWREGRKEIAVSENVVSEFREKIKKGECTVAQCCSELGISKGTWYNKLNKLAS